MVQIESVTAEILLIWTNVARTNVAWTNVTVTVGICCNCSQGLTFKVWDSTAYEFVWWSSLSLYGGVYTYFSVQLKPGFLGVRLKMSHKLIQNNFHVVETATLQEEGVKESIENVNNYRDNFVNIPVEEDQDVPDPSNSNLSMNLDLFGFGP